MLEHMNWKLGGPQRVENLPESLRGRVDDLFDRWRKEFDEFEDYDLKDLMSEVLRLAAHYDPHHLLAAASHLDGRV